MIGGNGGGPDSADYCNSAVWGPNGSVVVGGYAESDGLFPDSADVLGDTDAFLLRFEVPTGDPDPVPEPEPEFLRGDADTSGAVAALPDGLFILHAAFTPGAAQPECDDAADVKYDCFYHV